MMNDLNKYNLFNIADFLLLWHSDIKESYRMWRFLSFKHTQYLSIYVFFADIVGFTSPAWNITWLFQFCLLLLVEFSSANDWILLNLGMYVIAVFLHHGFDAISGILIP